MKKKLRAFLLAVLLAASPLFVQKVFALSCPECGGNMVRYSSSEAFVPTCTTGGEYIYICQNCKHQEVIPVGPLGHSYSETVKKEPTCTESGRAEYTCTRCGDHYTGILSPLGHDYEEETVDPTCEEDGKTIYTCSRCEDSYEDPIPALGHSFEVIEDTDPTCTEAGVRTERCTVCGEEETVLTEPAGHNFVYEETSALCSVDGSRHGVCSVCGEEENEILPALGHSFGEWVTVKAPGLYRSGERTRICLVCGEDETDTVAPLDPNGTITITVVSVLALLGLGLAAVLKWIPEIRIARKAAGIVEAAGGKPSMRKRNVILCLDKSSEGRKLEKCIRRKRFLIVKKPGETTPESSGEEKKPELSSLVLFSASSEAELESRLSELKEEYPNSDFGLLAGDGLTEEQLKANEDIFSFAFMGDKTARQFFRIVGPLYKPTEAGDEYLANATIITEALGLPILTIAINAFVVGCDVKDAVEVRGMNKADVADLINDAAALFGLDGLADTADSIRKGLETGSRMTNKKKIKNQEKAEEPKT